MNKLFGLVLLAIFILSGCGQSEEERAAAEDAAMESCKSTLTSNIKRSCRADPVFAYCSFNNDQNKIIGSGCTITIKNLPFSERADFCINESLESVFRTCAIEVYGCTAVTGDINC